MSNASTMRRHVVVVAAVVLTWQASMIGKAWGAPENALTKTWEAHGGLTEWRKQGTLTYTLNGFPLSAQVAKPFVSTVDLANRYNRIEGEGFVVGYDGNTAWSLPGPDAVGLPPRFFALGSFYFIGMPFVFADQGVLLEEQGTSVFRGKKYQMVKAAYKAGTGYTAKDDYILLIEPDTHLLKLIHHSVTEPSNKVERVTWVFDEWQRVSGLLIPKRMTFYGGWSEGTLPGPGLSCTIEKAEFRTAAPNPTLYARPADAVVDESPIY